MPNTSKKQYCSIDCIRHARNKRNAHKGYFKECIICNKSFKTISKIKITCTQKCLNIKNKDRETTSSISNKKTDFSIFKRDGFTCIYCGKSSIEDNVKLHIDHIYPAIKGGKNEINNLVTACKPCNLSKSAIILDIDILERVIKIVTYRNSSLSNSELIGLNESLVKIRKYFYGRKGSL